MCRFIAYLGNPLVLNEVLFKPKHSIIEQSLHSVESEETTNGDGFGLGWYNHEIDTKPALFRSVQPAWNDINLRYMSEKIRSQCFFTHVRAASKGNVSLANCHPFHHEHLMFMHNGTIGEFEKLKRHMRRELSDELYSWVQGQTDSEHFFAMFLQIFNQTGEHFGANSAARAIRKSLEHLEELRHHHKITEPTFINGVLTNGQCMVAVRYVSDSSLEARSLHYSFGERYEYHDGETHMIPSKNEDNGAVLIVSERLSSYNAEWHGVDKNHMLLVHNDLSVEITKL